MTTITKNHVESVNTLNAVEAKTPTRYAQARSEWEAVLATPALVLKLWAAQWLKAQNTGVCDTPHLVEMLKAAGVESRKDIEPSILFGRFYFDGAIHRIANKRDVERGKNLVDGFNREGEPCKYVRLENKPNAFLSALNQMLKDADYKKNLAARKAAKAAKRKQKKSK